MTKKLFSFLFLMHVTFPNIAFSNHCDPATNSNCHKFSGTISAVATHFRVPAGYFFSRRGVQRGWLQPDGQSTGTWRIRIMQWKMMGPQEAHNHFHQVVQSNLQSVGPVQSIESQLGEGLYQHQIECEDDCNGKGFDYYIELP